MNTLVRRARRFKGRFADIGMAAVSLVVGVILLVGTFQMEVRGTQVPGPQFFPLIVSSLLLVVGLVLLVTQLRSVPDADETTWHRPDISEDLLRDLGAKTELIKVDADRLEAAKARTDAASTDPDTAHPVDWRTVGIVIGAIVVFIVTLEFLGWILAAAGLFWLIAYAFGSTRHVFNIGISLLVASVVQLLFVAGLGLTLPSGFLGVFF